MHLCTSDIQSFLESHTQQCISASQSSNFSSIEHKQKCLRDQHLIFLLFLLILKIIQLHKCPSSYVLQFFPSKQTQTWSSSLAKHLKQLFLHIQGC